MILYITASRKERVNMRKHYLDNIRWPTVILVVVYHVLFMYNSVGLAVGTFPTEGPHYQDALLYMLYPWFMIILFIISGISARIYLEKHSIREFIRSRTDKLLVPSTLGLFVWCWIQGWISMKSSQLISPEPIMPENIPAPVMYFIQVLSGIGVLWFIQLLWVFSIVLALIRKLEKGKLYALCGKATTPVVILLVIPLFFAGLVLNTPFIPVYRFGYYGFGFLLGYFLFSQDAVIDRLRKYRFIFLPAALALGIFYTVMYYGQNYADATAHIEVINSVPAVAFAWVAVLAIFSCAREWFDKESNFTRFMVKKSFGIYMFHYIGLSAMALFLYRYEAVPLAVRYIAVLVAGLAAGYVLPEIIRRIPVLRFLIMGISKPKKNTDISKAKEAAAVQ